MVIKLSGEYGEGGGSIARVALALSTLTGKSFEVDNIRKGREKSGLKAQHLHCIKGAQQLCNAKVEGAELGSEYLKFEPSKLKSKNLHLDIGTAGSITLVLQSLLLPSIFGDKQMRIKLIGGSDCRWSPPFDYFNNVFLPHVKKYADIEASLVKRGYYPKGGGKVGIKIKPKFSFENLQEAQGINSTEQHNLIQIKGISHASLDLQKGQVAERQAKSAKLILNQLNCPIQIRTEYSDTLSTGSGITLWAIFSKDPGEIDFNNPIILGADALGERGKRSEQVGTEAADKLLEEITSKVPIDSHLADNLIPFLALVGGKIKVSKITNHTLTNIYVCEQFLGEVFKVDKENKVIESFLNSL